MGVSVSSAFRVPLVISSLARCTLCSFLWIGMLLLGACDPPSDPVTSLAPAESSSIENESEATEAESTSPPSDLAVGTSDLDESIFPLSFLMNDASDYSGCNPDVEGDTACF